MSIVEFVVNTVIVMLKSTSWSNERREFEWPQGIIGFYRRGFEWPQGIIEFYRRGFELPQGIIR
jgi:hypothetical protein